MKKYTAKPQKVRGLGNLHSLREANDYTEEDCTKSSLGNHSFEGIANSEYELTSTATDKRLTLTTPASTVYLGRSNYTLKATFKDENGDPITTGTNGATFFINDNQLETGVGFNSNGEAIYTGVVTASYPGTWAIVAKTSKNNVVYTSNQILLSAIKKPTEISYLDTVVQGTAYTGRLVDTITEQGIKNATITLRMSREDGTSKTYTLTTDNNGYFTYPKVSLSLGEYYFKISYPGSGIYEACTTSTFKVTVTNVKRQSVFKNISYEVPRTDYFQAQLVDKETDQPINNQSVSITLSRTNTQSTDNENSSRTYTITTDEDGYCKLQINLNEGLYKFNLEYAGNEAYEPTNTINNDLNVIPNDKETTYIIGSTSVVQYSNYTGVLVNSTGQPIEGMNILITMTNPTTGQSKTYGTGEIDSDGNVDELITTDSNGKFGKRITLAPGTYQFKSEFLGTTEYLASNTGTLYVTVIEKLKEATRIVADTSVYKGSNINGYLLDDSGEGIYGKNITINIARYDDVSQNRDYTVTTVDEGLFTLPINLTEGTYIFSYSFDGSEDSTYNSSILAPVITEVLAGTIPTTLTLTTAQISVGDYLEFTLLDENENPLNDCEVPITLYREYVDSTTGNLVEQQTTYYADRNGLTENGIVLCYWGITPQADSTYYVSASFAGGAGYMPSSVSKTVLSFTQANTNLTMTRSPNTSVVALDTRMNLNAQLLDSNNNAMSDKPITLNVTHSRIDGEITVTNNSNVVTATVVDEDNDAVPGLSVGFYNASTDTLIGSSTTDNNGECSYDCTGANSIYCQSSQTDGYEQITSENIQLANYLFYDDATDDSMLSTYNNASDVYFSGAGLVSFTYDSTNHRYIATNLRNNCEIGKTLVSSTSDTMTARLKFQLDSTSGNRQVGLYAMYGSNKYFFKLLVAGGVKRVETSVTGSDVSIASSFSLNKDYILEFIRNTTSLTGKIYDADTGTVIRTLTLTGSELTSGRTVEYGILFGATDGINIYFDEVSYSTS